MYHLLATHLNYSDYSITVIEYEEYKKCTSRQKSQVPEKLQGIWDDLVQRIEDPELKHEAEQKGFTIVNNPDMEDDIIAHYLMFQVPQASDELHSYIIENLYPFLVCIKDDDDDEDEYDYQ